MRPRKPYVPIAREHFDKPKAGASNPPADGPRRYLSRKGSKPPTTAKEIARTKAKDPSEKQIAYLRSQLGDESLAMTIRYVEFANNVESGGGSLNRWDILKGKTWLSRIYWIRAIDMLEYGSNDLYSAEELVAESEEI